MRRAAATWVVAAAGSAAAHAGLIALVLLAIAPDDEPSASRPEARIRIETQPVDQREARAADAGGAVAREAEGEGDSVSQESIPMSRAGPATPSSSSVPPADGIGARFGPEMAPAEPVTAVPTGGRRTDGAGLDAGRLTPASPPAAAIRAGERAPPAGSLLARAPAAEAVVPVWGDFPVLARAPAAGSFVEELDAVPDAVATVNPAAPVIGSPTTRGSAPDAVEDAADSLLALASPSDLIGSVMPTPEPALPVAQKLDGATLRAAAVAADGSLAPTTLDGTREEGRARPVAASGIRMQTASANEAADAVVLGPQPEASASLPLPRHRTSLARPDMQVIAAGAPRSEAAATSVPMPQAISAAALEHSRERPEKDPGGTPAEAGEPMFQRVGSSKAQVPIVASAAIHAEEPQPAPNDAVVLAAAPAPSGGRPTPISPPGVQLLATLAWTGGADAEVDPVSLSAIQSFMQPGDVEDHGGAEVRDALSQLVASVPCARIQSTFVPETGRLELHGHIPEESLRAPVLAALRGQVGSAIPVSDHMLILPRPQCSTLARIAATTLPQSTDQSPSSRVVGAEAYARIYDFSEGDRLVFSVTGADYGAYLYADYYDAEGTVIHLQPNEMVPLRRLGATEPLEIGGDAEGRMELRVAAPFGQDIVVVMAVSSALYDVLRPTREPALPYLRFLRQRVMQARAQDSGFKGEWLYFFVRTRAN